MNPRYFDRNLARLATIGAVALVCTTMVFGGTNFLQNDDEGPDGPGNSNIYTVTITNLTYNQIISPPVVAVHDGRFRLFEPGQPAGGELTALAEDGMTGPLVGLLEVAPGVFDYAAAAGGIPPTGSRRAKMLSLAGMLVSSNDAFVGLDGYVLPSGHFGSSSRATLHAAAWDSGSEANTESCDHIPGPPCGNGGVRVTDGAEGFVHVHRGIQGTGDLDASAKDWNNPVARITIQRN